MQPTTDNLETLAVELSRYANSWPGRAAVKKTEPLWPAFDPAKPDYLESLVPFRNHPIYQSASEELKRLALSCGWIAYNEKTIAIESKVVNPACMHIIDGDIPRLRDQLSREAASQALVDESYHILLIVSACAINRQRRRLLDLRLPQFELINRMRACQDRHPEPWKKILIQLACAIVSETMVSDYLRQMSKAEGVQPLNTLATEIHRRDESVHNALFKSLGASIFASLSLREQEFFMEVLPLPIDWFASAELEVWRAMLRQIDFPGAESMIDDCLFEQRSLGAGLDLTTLDELYTDLGIEREPIVRSV